MKAKKPKLKKGGNALELNLRFKRLLTTKTAPETQKARGVWVLLTSFKRPKIFPLLERVDNSYLGINTDTNTPCAVLDQKTGLMCDKPKSEHGSEQHTYEHPQGKAKFPDSYKLGSAVGFCRPCPKKGLGEKDGPRHGFVNSEEVTSFEESSAVYLKALEVDPRAEILLMPKLAATHSGIWVPESGVLIIGTGNDGATAGKDAITLPVIVQGISKGFREAAGIDSDAHVYVEVVKSGAYTYVVQARSGLPIPIGVKEYIPAKMKVEHIIEPTEDLLAWEALTVALKDSTGVAAHQFGGSLGSHPALHCMANHIPYLTRETVNVGDVIKPENVKKAEFDPKEFINGIRLTESSAIDKHDLSKGLQLGIGILHNLIQLEYSEHYSRLAGFALAWIFRASATACLGEARHYPKGKTTFGTKNRGLVYEKALQCTNEDLADKLATFSYKFLSNVWLSKGGFGGKPWYAATIKTIQLWNLITAKDISGAIGEANVLLNMAHNGGWLFNKFFSKEVMTQAANVPGEFLCIRIPELYSLLTAPIEYSVIKPRKIRASSKWKLNVLSKSKQFMVLKINTTTWERLCTTGSDMKLVKETFENV